MLFLSIGSLIVFADKTRKYQLPTCQDAIKFTFECKIIITLQKQKREKKFTILQVKSDGKEIVHEALPRLGEKFSTKREAGIEIGLSISKIYFKTIEAIIR